jgi:hypothetical protein
VDELRTDVLLSNPSEETHVWTYEYSLDTDKPAKDIWARYSDHTTWTEWDHGLQLVEADGPLAVGTTGSLTPNGQKPIPFTITEVEEQAAFTDECTVGGLVIRFRHQLSTLPGEGTRVTHAVVISGPNADQMGPKIGPSITADIPASVATLVELA